MGGKPLGLLCCPCCGRQKPVKPIKRGAKFKCVNCGCRSPLVLMRGNGTERPGLDLQEAMRSTLAGLLRHAEFKGFKPGFAAVKFRELFGMWPKIKTEPEPAAAALLLWVKRQNRAYAKARRDLEKANELPLAPEPISPLMTAEDLETEWR